jgi:hypothetical protein
VFAKSEVYTIPLPQNEDLERYARSLHFNGLKLNDNTVHAIMKYVNIPGNTANYSTMRRIIMALMEDSIIDGVRVAPQVQKPQQSNHVMMTLKKSAPAT